MAKKKEVLRAYKLTNSKHSYIDDESQLQRAKVGQIFDLTEAQARNWADRFELVEENKPRRRRSGRNKPDSPDPDSGDATDGETLED